MIYTDYIFKEAMGRVPLDSLNNPAVIIFTDNVEKHKQRIIDLYNPFVMKSFSGCVECYGGGIRFYILGKLSEGYRGLKGQLVILDKDIPQLYIDIVIRGMVRNDGVITRLHEVRNKGQKIY